METGIIILFYKYVPIDFPQQLQGWQKTVCQQLGLRGRIILATEGINGTLGGSPDAIEQYISIMRQNNLFADIDFKTSVGGADNFPRLQVSIKPEITALGIDPATLPASKAAEALTPHEVDTLLQNKPDNLVILDTRNRYESRIGTFVDAITPPIQYFKELPAYIDNNEQLFAGKQVLMFCTGGVRCERASAYLQEKGIAEKVWHIRGGIHRYVEEFPQGFFKGSNYVFDSRVAVTVSQDIIDHCDQCGIASNQTTNCNNAVCNKQYLSCNACRAATDLCCSRECQELVKTGKVPKRPYQKEVTYSHCELAHENNG
ncbi:rhodanese-related sulfurtransferase [Candidatus Dependentiae bacterium]|nr:rhodanese-related sulfurtransferase [Candidatus Dependentiae bacterium]